MTDEHDHHEGGHGGSPFIQHHYDDAQHQFDAGKLGIWFFLAQEILFFSALFVAYILYRNHRPEIFAYAHKYLDVRLGAINTCVLIISSLTAAWSVRCAQLGQKRGLILCIVVTIVCALGFLGIKFIEYRHKYIEGEGFGQYFDPCESSGGAALLTKLDHCDGVKRSACAAGNIDQDPNTPGWQVSCQVAELKGHVGGDGNFVEESRRPIPDACVMVREGNGPPESYIAVKDAAGNPVLDDKGEPKLEPSSEEHPCFEIAQNPWVCKPDQVAALVHYEEEDHVRWSDTQIELKCDPAAAPKLDMDAKLPSAGGPGAATVGEHTEKTERQLEEDAWMGPPPPHTNMFFTIYFAMTGLHGIHVLFGVFVFTWLLIRAIRGDFTPDYFGPIDYAALYWHLVDLIWIFLFPLLYLIH